MVQLEQRVAHQHLVAQVPNFSCGLVVYLIRACSGRAPAVPQLRHQVSDRFPAGRTNTPPL